MIYYRIHTPEKHNTESDSDLKYRQENIVKKYNYFINIINEANKKKEFVKFIVDCVGNVNSLQQEFQINMEKNIKKGLPPVWSYRPSKSIDKLKTGPKNKFFFKNDSGYKILDEKNKIII